MLVDAFADISAVYPLAVYADAVVYVVVLVGVDMLVVMVGPFLHDVVDTNLEENVLCAPRCCLR